MYVGPEIKGDGTVRAGLPNDTLDNQLSDSFVEFHYHICLFIMLYLPAIMSVYFLVAFGQ